MARGQSFKIKRLVWDISELKNIERFLVQLKVRGQQAMRAELNRIAKDILTRAQSKAPILSGRLVTSGRIVGAAKGASQAKTKFQVSVVFGGISVANQTGLGPPGNIFVNYAEFQELKHGFLQSAFNEVQPTIASRIAVAVSKHFKKGFKF